jgi:arylsulfatase B
MRQRAAAGRRDTARQSLRRANGGLNPARHPFASEPPMKKLALLLLAAFGFTAIVAAAPAAGAKPNLLILLADDLGYADVGFNGGKVVPTPNLDRLAATGIKLTDFRACPMCSPTRAGLMTGRWPARFGLMRAVIPPWSRYGLPKEEHTLPELLAPAGYASRGMTGKWHLGHARREFLPPAHGFTYFYGHYNGAIDYFTHERDGETDWHRGDQPVHEDGYSTDLLSDDAARFVREAPAGRPWFLYVPLNAPHGPFQAKEADLKKYPQLKGQHRTYAAMIDAMDQGLGRILAAVEARPDAANTLILFMSDNGGIPNVGSSNAPYRGAKLTVYEGGTRVCAAVRWPAGGLTGGGKFDGRIGYIDVLPTMLAAAGAAAPTNVDGLNFLPALRGAAAIPERPWFSYMHQNEDAHASVHLGRWKLVAHGDFFPEQPAKAPKLELYDLAADPGEKTDVAAKNPAVVADLHRRLREFGTWQKAGVSAYSEGQKGFVARKDWVIND